MVEQILPLLVGDLGFPFDRVEVDVVLEHSGERVVFILHGGDGLVEHAADVVLEILDGGNHLAVFIDPRFMPAGADRHEEGLAVGGLVFEQIGQQLRVQVGEVLPDGGAFQLELIGQALEEEHAEDEFLELRGIHLAAQDVGRLEKEGFELGEGDFFAGHVKRSRHTGKSGNLQFGAKPLE